MLKHLTEYEGDFADTLLFHGMQSTLKGLMEFERNREFVLDSEDFDSIYNESFLLLYKPSDESVHGIWDFGKYRPTASDYLFQTDYYPLGIPQAISKDGILDEIEECMSQFKIEYSTAEALEAVNGTKPLFIYNDIGNGRFLSYSLIDKAILIVKNYKEFKEDFELLTLDNENLHTERYTVYTPSEQYITRVNLHLDPISWKIILPWDKWTKRKHLVPNINVIRKFNNYYITNLRETYDNAIRALNKYRDKDLGNKEKYSTLEIRLKRLETLVELEAPEVIVLGAANLIYDSLLDLNVI